MAWHAGLYGEFSQKERGCALIQQNLIPSSGMNSRDFIVGVMWEPPGMVKLAIPDFNQDCGVIGPIMDRVGNSIVKILNILDVLGPCFALRIETE